MTKRYQHSIKRPRHRYSVKTKVTRVFGAGLVLSAIGLATFTLESPGTHGTELTSSNNVPLLAAGALDACSDANFSLGNAGYFGLYALGANGAVSTVTDDDVTGAAVFGGTVDTTHYVVNDNNVGDAKLYKGLALYAPDAVDEADSGSYAFLVDGDGYNTNVNADIEANHICDQPVLSRRGTDRQLLTIMARPGPNGCYHTLCGSDAIATAALGPIAHSA